MPKGLARDFGSDEVFAMFALSLSLVEWERSEAEATGGAEGGQKGGERSYYDLHCDLDETLLHLFTFLLFTF